MDINEPIREALSNVADRLARTARLEAINTTLREALEMILPLAESYLRNAPSSPDQAKLETARAAIAAAKREATK